MKILNSLFSFIFVLFLLSCNVNRNTSVVPSKPLPKSFMSNSDTLANELIKWKEIIFNPTLSKLIDTALKNNFDLKDALQKIEMSKSGVMLNKGIRLPDVNATTNLGRRKFGDYTMDGVGNYDTNLSDNINSDQLIPYQLPDYYVGFQSTWEIDLWGKLKNLKQSAAAKFMSSQYGKDLIVTNLIGEVASLYFELLALDKEVKMLTENIKLQENAYELMLAQKEVGRANQLAVELMKAQLLNSKTIQVEVEQQMMECEAKLNYLCGQYPGKISIDTSFYSNQVNLILKSGVPSNLLNNRPDIKQAEFEVLSTKANLSYARKAFYPSLNINSLIGLQSFNALLLLDFPASLAYNSIGSMAAPILNRRKLKSDLLLAKAQQKSAYINYEKSVVNAFKEVYVSLTNLSKTKEALNLKNEEVDVLKNSIMTSQELFKAGRCNYLEVITAQKNALESQIDLINIYKKQTIATIQLYKSLGGGWK